MDGRRKPCEMAFIPLLHRPSNSIFHCRTPTIAARAIKQLVFRLRHAQLQQTGAFNFMVTTGTDTNLRLVTPTAFPQQAAAQRAIKRGFDLVVALLAIACLSPLFALIALWIKLDSRGPVFFRQVRVGRSGHHFRIFKFRTMVADADQRGAQLTVGADQRITRSGRFLRGYKFDELPQFINVLLGEMTLVGPRPEVPRYVAQYSAQESAILSLTPGITSPASLVYRAESELLAQQADPEQFYLAEVMPAKIRTDLAYARCATWRSDLRIIAQTLLRILN